VKIVQEFGYNEMMRKKKVIRIIKLEAKARHKPCFEKFMLQVYEVWYIYFVVGP